MIEQCPKLIPNILIWFPNILIWFPNILIWFPNILIWFPNILIWFLNILIASLMANLQGHKLIVMKDCHSGKALLKRKHPQYTDIKRYIAHTFSFIFNVHFIQEVLLFILSMYIYTLIICYA